MPYSRSEESLSGFNIPVIKPYHHMITSFVRNQKRKHVKEEKLVENSRNLSVLQKSSYTCLSLKKKLCLPEAMFEGWESSSSSVPFSVF
jgi:hypothetical protein